MQDLTTGDLEERIAHERVLRHLDDIAEQLDPRRWGPVVR